MYTYKWMRYGLYHQTQDLYGEIGIQNYQNYVHALIRPYHKWNISKCLEGKKLKTLLTRKLWEDFLVKAITDPLVHCFPKMTIRAFVVSCDMAAHSSILAMDRRARRTTVHGVAKQSDTTEQQSAISSESCWQLDRCGIGIKGLRVRQGQWGHTHLCTPVAASWVLSPQSHFVLIRKGEQ